jgi:hypothetical protein
MGDAEEVVETLEDLASHGSGARGPLPADWKPVHARRVVRAIKKAGGGWDVNFTDGHYNLRPHTWVETVKYNSATALVGLGLAFLAGVMCGRVVPAK